MELLIAQNAVDELAAADELASVQRIVRTAARELAHADGATIVLRDVDHCFYADEDAISPLWKGQRFPLTNCISGWAMLHAQTVVVPDIAADERIPIEAYRPTFVKSLVVVPVGDEKPMAAIGAYWAQNRTATDEEVVALESLAASTGEAIGRIGLFGIAPPPVLAPHAGPGRVDPVDWSLGGSATSEDHERIARDLHDTVLQRLFGAGLRLQALVQGIDDPVAVERINETIIQIDESIRELRGAVFGLEYGHGELGGLSGEILAVAAEWARVLGFDPDVLLDGPLGDVGDGVRRELLGALREMLSNVSRHARASAVRIECEVGASISLKVTDNGVGPAPDRVAGNGLGNLRARAEALGGSFSIEPVTGGGALAIWTAPLQ